MGSVIVIGGGPTGLWTAAELRLRGVDVVVEKLPERSPYTKGFTVQPRTMEVWASRGIAERFVEHGKRIPNVTSDSSTSGWTSGPWTPRSRTP